MNVQLQYLALLAVLGFVLTYCLIPVTKKLAFAYGFVSFPGVRTHIPHLRMRSWDDFSVQK
ncbi:MAG: hypothetical protein ACP5VS_16600 [Desulfomonilaceae bacterium]